jgi:hypothetical protein
MPILIWIATAACMLEVATGHAVYHTGTDLPARSGKDLALRSR